jgi:Winged helix-turn-helix DNA-binding
MMPPTGTEQCRPGFLTATSAPLACLGSLLWQSKGEINASGKSSHAPGARDHSSEVSASLPTREIARRLGLSPSTVRETWSRLENAGLFWPLPEGISDAELEVALYAHRRSKRGHRRLPEPDWPAVHRELKRKHVTLLIVWDEYIAANRAGSGCLNSFPRMISGVPPGFVRSMAPGVGCDGGRAIARP